MLLLFSWIGICVELLRCGSFCSDIISTILFRPMISCLSCHRSSWYPGENDVCSDVSAYVMPLNCSITGKFHDNKFCCYMMWPLMLASSPALCGKVWGQPAGTCTHGFVPAWFHPIIVVTAEVKIKCAWLPHKTRVKKVNKYLICHFYTHCH